MNVSLLSPQRKLALLVVLFLLATSALAPMLATPTSAQPLCLNGTIWDAKQGACVELTSPTPTEEVSQSTSEATLEPTFDDEDTADDEAEQDPSDEEDTDQDEMAEPTPEDDSLERTTDYPTQLGFFTYECPWNFDLVNADRDTRMNTCSKWLGGVEYDLTLDGYGFETQVSPNFAGGAGWYDLGSGLAEITITAPINYTLPLVIACETSSLVVPPRNVMYKDNSGQSGLSGFRMELEEHDIWYCSSYFMESPTGSVSLKVRGCPNTLDIYNISPTDLAANCQTLIPDIEFMMQHNPTGVSTTYTSNASIAIFNRVRPGTGHITMYPPAGIGLPVVYCETIGPQGQTLSQYDWVYIPINASFDVSFAQGETTFCDVFVVNGGIEIEQESGNPDWVEGMPPASPPASSDEG